MRIIEEGNSRRIRCEKCECLFEYDVKDIEHLRGMTCMNKGTAIVRCPHCNAMISIKGGFEVNRLGHFKFNSRKR